MASVKDWDGLTTAYAYDNANRLITTMLPNGVSSANAYDNANRLTRLTHSNAGANLGDYQYALDALGNRTAVTETLKVFTDFGIVAPVRLPTPPPPPVKVKSSHTYAIFLPFIGTGAKGLTSGATTTAVTATLQTSTGGGLAPADGPPLRATTSLTYTSFLAFIGTSATVFYPGAATTTINYVYDLLSRLTKATSTGV